jgi:hypothetical protein
MGRGEVRNGKPEIFSALRTIATGFLCRLLSNMDTHAFKPWGQSYFRSQLLCQSLGLFRLMSSSLS